jgi:hypothetical protein
MGAFGHQLTLVDADWASASDCKEPVVAVRRGHLHELDDRGFCRAVVPRWQGIDLPECRRAEGESETKRKGVR